eukprot:scaffold37061_cov183-Skeletonema_dohrnii-CCMP3373.AAC.2
MLSQISKRRKFVTDASSQCSTCSLYDLLPGGILKEVASFLEAPSRVLFAIAITPPSSPYDIVLARCRPRVSRSSIEGNDWHTLDFGDIEKELAAKLTDDDISQVLLHIDAAHKVKRLRLTNCINISGSGLAPLRYSTSIEQIDLSLVGAHQLSQLNPTPPLSCDLVLPILESIISHERNSLINLLFPHDWRRKEPVDTRFKEFLERYDSMLEIRLTNTACCGNDLITYELISFDDEDYGVQYHTCSLCAKNYCYDCTDEYGNKLLHFCSTCERNYCSSCASKNACSACYAFLCEDCIPHTACAERYCMNVICNECLLSNKCGECKKRWCITCSDCLQCEDCLVERCCAECSEKEGVNGVHECYDNYCRSTLCDKCRMKQCQSGENNCKECVNTISSVLLAETKKLQEEVKSLKDRNKLMGDEMKGLKEEMRVIGMMAS